MKKTKWATKRNRMLRGILFLAVLSLGLAGTGCSAEMTQTLTDALTSATSSVLDAVLNSLLTSATSTT